MSVYTKLMAARMKLHSQAIKKSGRNTFANYNYMELADFLIPTQTIFSELGLCGVVSFTADIASLTIIDTDDGSQLVLTSPMGSAALKGCHEVQNIGAVETYQRRYLWVAAMEIVEHDAIDGSPPADKVEKKEDSRDPFSIFTPAQAKKVREVAQACIQAFNEGNEWSAYEEYSTFLAKASSDEARTDIQLAMSVIFKPHSALRSSLKKHAEAERAAKVTA